MLKNEVLEFEKTVITENEMAEHVNYYYHRAIDGMKLLTEKKHSEAMQLLRELNKSLAKENKHYQLVKVQEVIYGSPSASSYSSAIAEAHAKQTQQNSYSMLSSNFDDIQSSMQYNCGDLVQEQ